MAFYGVSIFFILFDFPHGVVLLYKRHHLGKLVRVIEAVLTGIERCVNLVDDDEHTVKTFYVGSDPFMIAMAKSGKTVKELDEFISQGYTIEADGSLVAPPEPEPEIEEEPEQEEIAEEKATEEVKEEVAATPTEQDTKTEVGEEKVTTEDSADVKEEAEIEEPEEETKKSSGVMGIIVVLSIIVAGAAVAFAMYKKKNAGNISVKTDTDNEEKGGES